MADANLADGEPIHAESFFSVSQTGEVHERLYFEYRDYDGYYFDLLKDNEAFGEEIAKLSSNMQYYLDQERVEFNGERVMSIVRYTDIVMKGETNFVAVLYLIDFAGRFTPSTNTIETWLEREIAPYDFEIIWRFPAGTTIEQIETDLEFEIYRDFVVLWALEGDDVGGYERMTFELPEKTLDTRHMVED
ncbi:hypothetical protein EU546_05990 [Candidatus Thorarchaeota archaeon]|nr:MAG: hypothetical protein EU546_05990 [Candidatus Thorarchaeota archaeon]